MDAVRTILAALIAISVVLLPMSGDVAVQAKPVEMSMAGQADMPCCNPDDCKDAFACALKCFNYAPAIFPEAIGPPSSAVSAPPLLADDSLSGQIRSPPTRPPNA